MGNLMDERVKYEGRLRMAEIEAEKLRMRCRTIIRSIRDILDPTEEVEKIDVQTLVVELTPDLHTAQSDLKRVLRNIHDIRSLIGG